MKRAPEKAVVTDYMCATGMLLSHIAGSRPDIYAAGCDIHYDFVEYANSSRPHLDIEHADAWEYRLDREHDVIACTAGLHHLPFDDHKRFLKDLRGACNRHTLVIIGEEVLPTHDADSDGARLRAAIDLNLDLVRYALDEESPRELVEAALTVLRNDALLDGEYKRDLASWNDLVAEQFNVEDVVPCWRTKGGGGDYLFICTPA